MKDLNSEKCLNVGLWGIGSFASKAYIPALLNLEKDGRVFLAAVCSRTESTLRRLRGTLPLADSRKYYSNDEDFLADKDIDLIIIVLPIGVLSHAVKKALLSGKPVLSEKPCGASLKEALELLDFYKNTPNLAYWGVSENYRNKKIVKKIKDLLDDGVVGKTLSVSLDFNFKVNPDPNEWRQSSSHKGGYFLDFCVHYIAALRYCFGEFKEVHSYCQQTLPYTSGNDDLQSIILFENNIPGVLKFGFSSQVVDHRNPELKITGTHGIICVNFQKSWLEIIRQDGLQHIDFTDDGWETGGVEETLRYVIDANSLDLIKPEEAFADVAVIEALLLSSDRKRPVMVDELIPPTLRLKNREIKTFESSISYEPKTAVYCKTISEIQALIVCQEAEVTKIRVRGAGRSWATPIITNNLMISTEKLESSIFVNVEESTVTVSAGVQIGVLNRVLASHNLCIPSLTCSPESTVGGVVSTGSHGSSISYGTISDYISGMKILLASGEIIDINSYSNPDFLNAARVSVGLLGIVLEVTLEVKKIRNVNFYRDTFMVDDFVSIQEDLWVNFDYAWAKWPLGSSKIHLIYGKNVDDGGSGMPYIDLNSEQPIWHSFLPDPEYAHSCPSLHMRDPAIKSLSMQYAFSDRQFYEILNEIKISSFCEENQGKIVEFKYINGESKSFLGCNIFPRNLAVNLAWADVPQQHKNTIFDGFEEIAQNFLGRPHWGKFHKVSSVDYVNSCFPNWENFLKIQKLLDPRGVFVFDSSWM